MGAALPFFGIVTEVFPVFARKPVFGYVGLIGATISIAGLSVTVWAHHTFATGMLLPGMRLSGPAEVTVQAWQIHVHYWDLLVDRDWFPGRD